MTQTFHRTRDQTTGDLHSGVRRGDGALIPEDPRNIDWQDYQAWLAAGNVPAEFVTPDVQAAPRAAGR